MADVAENLKQLGQDPRCIGIALAALPTSYIESVIKVIGTVVAVLKSYNDLILAEITYIDITSIPLALRAAGMKKAAEAVTGAIQVVGTARALTDTVLTEVNIIDNALTTACPILGELNHIVSKALEPTLSQFTRVLEYQNRVRAIKIGYKNVHDQIDAYINYLDMVRGYMQQLLTARTAAQVIASVRVNIK